jgi:hypothetical protein
VEAKANNREEWTSVVKKAKVFRGAQSQGVTSCPKFYFVSVMNDEGTNRALFRAGNNLFFPRVPTASLWASLLTCRPVLYAWLDLLVMVVLKMEATYSSETSVAF